MKLIALILAAMASTAFAGTDVSYDRFKDVTTVTGEPTPLDTKTPHARISLSAVATFSGNRCTGVPDSIGLLVSSRSSEWVFLQDQATTQAIFIFPKFSLANPL